MEAVVKISGKQYRVAEGERVTVDRLQTKVGDKVTFDQVLLLTDGARATVGTPTINGAAVTATVVATQRGPKLIVYKYKAKKRYRRTQGARAEQSLLQVLSVTGPGDKPRTAKPARAEAEKPATAQAEEPAKPARAEAEKPATATAEKTPPKPRAKKAAPTETKTDKPVSKPKAKKE